MTTKTIEYRVLVTVDDFGQMDEGTILDAICTGISIAQQEGSLTTLDDESTIIEGFTVSHVGTK